MAEPDLVAPSDVRYTQSEDGKRLYVHLLAYPFTHLFLPGLTGRVEYTQFLHDGSELAFTDGEVGILPGDNVGLSPENKVVITLPVVKPDIVVPTIELFLK